MFKNILFTKQLLARSIMQLSKDAFKVQDALKQKGLECRVVELAQSTHTAQEAAKAVNCELEQIVKSLMFKTITQQPILVLASGANRVNEKVIAAHIGEKVIKADAEFTKKITGFSIGGIPPLAPNKDTRIFVDEDLLKFETLWAAAGTPHAVFSIAAVSLLQLLENGAVINIKELNRSSPKYHLAV